MGIVASRPYRQRIFTASGFWNVNRPPEAYIRCFGVFESLGGFTYEQVAKNFCFHLIRSGNGVARRDGEDFELGAGDLFLFWPGAHIYYYDLPGTPWKYDWFSMSGPRAEEAIRAVGLTPNAPRLRDGTRRFFARAAAVRKTFERENYAPTFPIAAAWELLNILSEDTRRERSGPGADILEQCVAWIESGRGEYPDVAELAARAGVSRSTLFRLFKERFDVSPKQHIENQRLAAARDLLRRSSKTIKEIAALCGFDSQAYFGQVFRARHGVSPAAWRRTPQ